MAEQPDRQIRIGTSEREAAIKALGGHLSSGHLEMDEYTERVDRAVAARTSGDLDALFVDLPAPHYRPPPPLATHHPPPFSLPVPGVGHYPAPHGYDQFGRPLSDKSKVAAGLLQIVLPFGIGRFYMGDVGIGLAQLFLALLFGVGVIWCIIDGIVILARGGTDRHGRPLRG